MKLSREKIDLYRAAKCFSVKDLAEEYGVSRARMHSILGQRDVTPLVAGRMARALGVEVTEILDRKSVV